ncbi:MAG: type II toxin-antitoxin system RelE/ParE family toxin [Thermodesulfovibrionia bacterium]
MKVIILPRALEYLSRLNKAVSQRITDKLTRLSENIETIPLLPLKGPLAGFYKVRVSDWRVIYDVNHDKQIITVHKIGHRREIYE